ncbi:MAG TPA: hypothetical protein VK624_04110 [Steroidobacteraceae bacterium]|nr:hypothetical protein [Steroidobacteraceae bacterium]
MGNAFRDGHWRILTAAVLVLSAAAMAAGIGFVFMAWKRASLPFGVTGVVLLLAAPPLAVAALLARNFTSRAPDCLRAQSFIDEVHRADSTLRMIRRMRAHLGVAAASTFLAWVCEAFDLADFRDFAFCLTLLVAIAAAGYLPWLARQEKLVREQREVLRRGLIASQIAEKWFAG